MDVKNVEKKENGKLSFQVELDRAAFEAAINKAYQKAKKDIYVPGFRKGKAPRMVVEGMYGAEVFYEDAVNEIAPAAYEAGLKQADVRVVGRPALTDFTVSEEKALTIDFEVALYPEVTLGEYKGIEVYKEKCEVSEEEIAGELERVQKRNARIQVVEREAANGDTVNIDYDGYKDGVRFDGGKDEGHDLVLGSNSFVPGFEEQLVGMKAGEEKDIDITFPENYHEGLSGAAVVFKVKVNEVKESILPELDDDFAKDVSEFDTLDEFKASIADRLLKSKEANAQNEFEFAALAKAVGNMTVNVPEEMVEEQLDNMVNDYRQNVAMQGMDFAQYLGMMGMDESSFRGIMRPSAENQTKNEILLEAIAAAEGLEPSEEEVEEEYKRVAGMYGAELEQVKAAVASEMVIRDLKLKKAADVLYSNAVITDVKPEAEAPAEAE